MDDANEWNAIQRLALHSPDRGEVLSTDVEVELTMAVTAAIPGLAVLGKDIYFIMGQLFFHIYRMSHLNGFQQECAVWCIDSFNLEQSK